ncbi:CPBP family glutamic-type intramembrane protease [Stenotrophomonas sp.]|uniref:CPBP family glutamic-type intramembrane protease n=1 Tax=Stenotrophomonas sp. TaxID=69392 RepID=UPI0028A1C330|nr:CPBP family glutamic-type intramembrane protease [Stenotrophomonas sp.]
MKRPQANPQNFLITAALCWAGVGFVEMVLQDIGFGAFKLVTELTAFAVLALLFPETRHWQRSWKKYALAMLLPVGMFFAWLWIYADPSVEEKIAWKQAGWVAVAITYLTTVVAAPLFEEKLLRGLAVPGVIGTTPVWIQRYVRAEVFGAVVISVVFGLAHPSFAFLAFLFSLALCFLSIRFKFTAVQCACVHGLYNCAVTTWYQTFGFGSWA